MSLIVDVEGIDSTIDALGGYAAFLERYTGTVVHNITNNAADIVRASLARYQKTNNELVDSVKEEHEPMAGIVRLNGTGVTKIERLLRGTPAHTITAKRGKALRFAWGGGIHFYKQVNHPGTQPIDILSGAFDSIRAMAEQESGNRFNP